jgi:phosphinothricin acetyltransferase
MLNNPKPAQSGSQVTIRRAGVEDLAQIVAIWAEGQLSQGDQPDLAQGAKAFGARVESQTEIYGVWVAEIEGSVVGWQSLHPCRANPIHKWAESSTYIAQDCTGCGIGRKLLTFATQHANSARLSYVVGFIKKGNEPPIRIVESLGWQKVGDLPRADENDIEWLYYVYPVPHSHTNRKTCPILCSDAAATEPVWSEVEALTQEGSPEL